MAKEVKEELLNIRATEAQKTKILENASAYGLKYSPYLLHIAQLVPALALPLGGEMQALEDLRNFYNWQRLETIKTLKGVFTREELWVIVDRFNGTMLPPIFKMETDPSILYAEIEDGELYQGSAQTFGANANNLFAKIKKLTPIQCFFLRREAYNTWYGEGKNGDIAGFLKMFMKDE
jgi:hypothetical protein